MAIYISGYSILHPTKSLRRWIRRRGGIRKFITEFIKRDTRFDFYARTNKLFSSIYHSFSGSLGLNRIYWPTGANRFAVGIFLVSEMQASVIFSISAASSNTRFLMTDKISGSGGFSITSHCFTLTREDSPPEQPPTPPTEIPSPQDIVAANQGMSDYSIKFNLMPVQVVVTQRAYSYRPFDKQSFFATWLIPLLYIPIVESDNITDRTSYNAEGVDGFGILIMVDQRFLWQFTPIPTIYYLIPNSNECYFSWYKLTNALIRTYLLPFQYDKQLLSKYGRKLFWDNITVDIEDPDADPVDICQLNRRKRDRKFDDDRALFGVPIDFYTDKADYMLSEIFGMIEQSLSKKLLFHPNWQIEFVNPYIARKRALRNLLFFTPRVVYKNDIIPQELGFDNWPPTTQMTTPSGSTSEVDLSFAKEFPIIAGGLPVSISKNKIVLSSDGTRFDVTNRRITEVPEPRHMVMMPHVLEVVGNVWYSPDPKSDNPDINEEAGTFVPFGYTYYKACLVPRTYTNISNTNVYEFIDDDKWFYIDDEFGVNDWFYSAFIPGTYMALTDSVPLDLSIHRILTTHLCIVATKEQDIQINNPQEESKTFMNKAVSIRLGRKIVRDWLSWYGLPFTWEFYASCYWPITGYEDCIIFYNSGRVKVIGHHANFISRKSGIKSVGWESPNTTYSALTESHKLLDDKKHVDCSGDDVSINALVTVHPGY